MTASPSDRNQGVARYEHVDEAYLERRRLKKSADWLLLWALGVGAVISGDYLGWNTGLGVGGFPGLAWATLLAAVMYLCMVYSIAELSAALPHAGGFYSFVRSAMGPTAGYICGVTDAIEYILTPAVIVVGIGGYLHNLLPVVPIYVWWLIAYALFVGVNIRGAELTLKVGLFITLLAVAVLAIFYVSALASGSFHWELLFNQSAGTGEDSATPQAGWAGVVGSLPFAIWFFLAIEQLPLAAEETHDVVNDMPRALVAGVFTLMGLALCTLILNTGVGGGAAALAHSQAPLADGFLAIYGVGVVSSVLTFLALAGLIASFHTTIYAYGRVLFALSRAGYVPRWISITSRWHTPSNALALGAAVGLAAAAAIDWAGAESLVGGALLNMAVFGAVVSYSLVLFSYIHLRLSRPNLLRPYRSPLGLPGAVVGLVLALVSLAATFTVPEYRTGVVGAAVFLALAMVYFLLYSSRRLVAQAPEEEIALVAQAEKELH